MINLRGKTIVVTGASSGVGRAIALEFAKHETFVVLAGRNESALKEVAQECEEEGAKALVVPTDVTDADALVRLVNTAKGWDGKIDVWVNNAGVLAAGDFDATPIATHRQVITTNLLGYIYGAHAVMPLFKEQQSGVLINNISVGGFLPVPYGVAYTSSKFGIVGFSQALRGELANWHGIHVCDLFPAFLNTPGIQHAANYTGKVLKPAPPLSDPMEIARIAVGVAMRPKSTTYIGLAPYAFKAAHTLLPETTTWATGQVMRKYFQHADAIEHTDGNVFGTVDYGMAMHGNMRVVKKSGKKQLLTGLVTLFAIGIYLYSSNRKSHV